MRISLTWQGKEYTANLDEPLPISIPLKDGPDNPNCYYTEAAIFTPVKAAGFIGSIDQGGSVNHYQITLAPHGNGTHTECYGHVTNSGAVIANQVQKYFNVAQLITIRPTVSGDDRIIDLQCLNSLTIRSGVNALIIRTLPNEPAKQQYNYSGKNPPYFSVDIVNQFVSLGIEHLVTDLPSVDKEVDGGKLAAHKAFWQTQGNLRSNATITELAYIANEIPDGIYLLDLQVLPIYLDASPSNPILYSLKST